MTKEKELNLRRGKLKTNKFGKFVFNLRKKKLKKNSNLI
jgi:hypothetical protein